MTVPEGGLLVVYILTCPYIKTVSSVVSDVTIWTSKKGDSLEVFVFPLSDDCSLANVKGLSKFVRYDIVGFPVSSDGLGSAVKFPPLSLFVNLIVFDSDSELITANVFLP